MGVPKFFRWLSERYPAISQLIADNRIPEFDCLYLDMNGIIHNCTHKDSDSPTTRVTEEKMFIDIFNYIEHLFGKIKPKKLFFMAIDGVAPRAKMNQQRARRFRTALDNEVAMKKAIAQGVEMPKEDAFDSNCITPGTAFMAKLTQQLQYFIHKKISEDADWRGCEVVLSGHEVPGEGEHKIMEYIRLAKAQPDYDPNIRHCLYGLDADLIMLGLLSHDPHFCLLREEVTFGRASKTKSKELEHQNFYLMHLSIVREYLELEFQELKEPGALSFGFDMERVIDDFILLAFFVGNDFLPNLPGLHINEGALALMFKIYKEVIIKAGGYINEHGVINIERLGLLLGELEQFEFRVFEAESDDANWLKSKTKGHLQALEEKKAKGRLALTPQQKGLYKKIKKWVSDRFVLKGTESIDLPATLPASDRAFVEALAKSLGVEVYTPEDVDGNRHLRLFLSREAFSDTEEEEESRVALERVFKRYDKAPVIEMETEDQQAELERRYQEKFLEWRDEYYKEKLHFSVNDEAAMKDLCENYVQGLQWVLYYYYQGVASWPWFYRYHYAPKISDVRKGLGADLNFRLGKPFRPFEQLMGVLPDRSKKIVPEPYWGLMTSPTSSIIDFYPRDFELDKNGKKQDWEAVVLIPFIEEDRLLKAMKTKEHLLTPAERARNDFGVTLKFAYAPELNYLYPSSMPGVFPDLTHCKCLTNIFELPTLEGLKLVPGLCDGVKLGASALAGFPSLNTLPHTGHLDFHGVNIFQMDSRNESMVIKLTEDYDVARLQEAKEKIGQRIHVGYPFLNEALVTAVSDELFRYVKADDGINVVPIPHGPFELNNWRRKADRLENHYSKRMGMVIGPVEIIFHVEMLKGLKRRDDGAMVKEYGEIPGLDTEYAGQTVVYEVAEEDGRFIEKPAVPIWEEFPEGERAFFLGEFNYGQPLEVLDHTGDRANVWVSIQKGLDNMFARKIVQASENTRYYPSYQVARMLQMNSLALSKITSSFSVSVDGERSNLGLNLKFEAKKLKVLGYSRRGPNGWEFSERAVALLQEYKQKFPDFFAGIERNPHADIYQDTDFYPDNTAAKIKEIKQWLKKLEKLEKVPLDAQQLDGEAVMEIQNMADYLNSQLPMPSTTRIRGAPRNSLLKPADAEHRLADQRFQLGDRVVYVQDSGKVPIATRGTVVGITTNTRIHILDVVFDLSFMSGTSLGGRCSPFRGMNVPVSAVLNITDRQLIVSTKASKANAPNVIVAPNSAGLKTQWKPAANPAPLQGSFSGAIANPQQHAPNGRGRGRGGFNGAPPSGPSGRGVRGGALHILQRAVAQQPAAQQYAHGIMTDATSTTTSHQNIQVTRGRGRGRGGNVVIQQRNTTVQETVQTTTQQVVQPTQAAAQGPEGESILIPAQGYNAVPPPQNLNQRGGRGRGGRGGRGRGGFRGGRGGQAPVNA